MTGNSQTLEPAASFSTTPSVSAPTDRALSKGGTTGDGHETARGFRARRAAGVPVPAPDPPTRSHPDAQGATRP